MRGFIVRVMIGCLVLSLGAIGLFSQPFPEFSLDDHPNNVIVPPPLPLGPWSPGAPWFVPSGSAEDEFGLGLPGAVAGFIGPSPSLLPVPPQPGPFNDSDILVAGPALLVAFPPPPFYMDAVSTNNWEMSVCDTIFVEFSVDRATGGATPADASWRQAGLNEQPGDIYRVDQPGFAHASLFVPLPPPIAVPPPGPPIFPWTFYCGGLIDPANGFTSPPYARPGPAGMGGGGNNWLLYDHFGLGLAPMGPAPYPAITPGSHDNIDAYNRWLYSLVNSPNTDIYFCLHPASAALLGPGLSAADIFNCTQPGGLFWPPTGVFAPSWMMGLDVSSGNYKPNQDSIDGLAVFDNGIPGVLEPGIDFAGFTLAPGSATLTALAGPPFFFPANAAAIFVTDFQTYIPPPPGPQMPVGYFYVYLLDTDIGVGNGPFPPLPGVPFVDINVDALELTIDPLPIPYTNPVTRPVIDPVTKK